MLASSSVLRTIRTSRAAALAAIYVLGAASSGCEPGVSNRPSAPGNDVRLDVPVGHYVGITWLPDGRLVINEAIPDALGGTRLGYSLSLVDLNGGSPGPLAVPPVERCWRELYLNPGVLPDGRLSFVRSCLHSVEGEPPDEADLVAMDPAPGAELKVVMKLGQLDIRKNVSYTVMPDLSEVIYDVGSGACLGIAVATASDTSGRLHLVVGEAPTQFRLDQPADLLGPCDGAVIAGGPALSPDGTTLAFVASPHSVGVSGLQARLAQPLDVYLADLPSERTRRLVGDLDGATGLAWSPDGKQLAYAGGAANTGVWLVDSASGTTHLMSAGDFRYLAWAESGDTIAAIRQVSDPQDFGLGEVMLLRVTK
jgi:hypothetical protein